MKSLILALALIAFTGLNALADNHRFLAIMSWDGENRITKYLPFPTEAEADAHIAAHVGQYPNAFSAVVPTTPEGKLRDYVVDEAAGTVAYTPEPGPPPPTDDERIDEAFNQASDKNVVLLKAFRKLANDIRTLENTVNGTSQPMLTLSQVRDWFKGELEPPQ